MMTFMSFKHTPLNLYLFYMTLSILSLLPNVLQCNFLKLTNFARRFALKYADDLKQMLYQRLVLVEVLYLPILVAYYIISVQDSDGSVLYNTELFYTVSNLIDQACKLFEILCRSQCVGASATISPMYWSESEDTLIMQRAGS